MRTEKQMSRNIRIVGVAGGVLSVSVYADGRWQWLGYYPTGAEAIQATLILVCDDE